VKIQMSGANREWVEKVTYLERQVEEFVTI
jgi:hypothetical protein